MTNEIKIPPYRGPDLYQPRIDALVAVAEAAYLVSYHSGFSKSIFPQLREVVDNLYQTEEPKEEKEPCKHITQGLTWIKEDENYYGHWYCRQCKTPLATEVEKTKCLKPLYLCPKCEGGPNLLCNRCFRCFNRGWVTE